MDPHDVIVRTFVLIVLPIIGILVAFAGRAGKVGTMGLLLFGAILASVLVFAPMAQLRQAATTVATGFLSFIGG